jgi:TonB family protein
MHALPLGGAAHPFASYIVAMHNRIHPEFMDKELRKLDTLPADHPLNRKDMFVRLELVLSAVDGRTVSITVVRPSGVAEFDLMAIDSVRRAEPFGPAPQPITSADGNVYIKWEFFRNPEHACSAFNSRPLLFGP